MNREPRRILAEDEGKPHGQGIASGPSITAHGRQAGWGEAVGGTLGRLSGGQYGVEVIRQLLATVGEVVVGRVLTSQVSCANLRS